MPHAAAEGDLSADSVQADGGVMMGLPRAEALELAAQSEFVRVAHYIQFSDRLQALQGAARMVLQHGAHPAQIKDTVTSKSNASNHAFFAVFGPVHVHELTIFRIAPGGCTIAGLLALEDGRVRSTIARGIQIATERASELGQPAKQ